MIRVEQIAVDGSLSSVDEAFSIQRILRGIEEDLIARYGGAKLVTMWPTTSDTYTNYYTVVWDRQGLREDEE